MKFNPFNLIGGNCERLYPLLEEADFPDELIMNYWPDKFFDYLGINREI